MRSSRPRPSRYRAAYSRFGLYRSTAAVDRSAFVQGTARAIRMLFDWRVLGRILPINPAKRGSWAGACSEERQNPGTFRKVSPPLLDSIATQHHSPSPRIISASRTCTPKSAGLGCGCMGKRHKMPCHHKLETFLEEYITAAGIADDPEVAALAGNRNIKMTLRYVIRPRSAVLSSWSLSIHSTKKPQQRGLHFG